MLGLAPVKKVVGVTYLEGMLAGLVHVKQVTISSEHICLTTTALALLLMVGGSLLFPDKKTHPQVEA